MKAAAAERTGGMTGATPAAPWSQDDPRLARRPVSSAAGAVEEPGQAYDVREPRVRPRGDV